MTCLSDAFPQTDSPACAPGFPGLLCVDSLGCTAGACASWGDVDPIMQGLETCSPKCNSDDDCVAFDRGGNPSVITRNTCHNGVCRSLQSLFFPLTCLRPGDHCQLDPDQSICELLDAAPATGAPDMAGQPPSCGPVDPLQMGLGAFGGSALVCTRTCKVRSDCDDLSQKLNVPLGCDDTRVGKRCVPILPFITHCQTSDDCFGKLSCLPMTTAPSSPLVCTQKCQSHADCASNPALGSTFACVGGQCTPKIEAGCPSTVADVCISGQLDGSGKKCVSPLDWACTADGQCTSGHCVFIEGTQPAFGRCE